MIQPAETEGLNITFDPSLSVEQMEVALTALSDYYRACGGVGLKLSPTEVELQAILIIDRHRLPGRIVDSPKEFSGD